MSAHTETSPLLPSSSPSSPPPPRSSFPFRTVLFLTLYSTLTLLFSGSLFTLLLASSYAPAFADKQALQNALVFSGPRDVKLLNVSDDGSMWFQVEVALGIDADRALGFHPEGEDGIWWERTRRRWGRWAVDAIDEVSVSMNAPIQLQTSDRIPLLTVVPDSTPLLLPLTPSLQSSHPPVYPSSTSDRSPTAPSWLKRFTLQASVSLDASPDILLSFAKKAWRDKTMDVVACLENDAVIVGGVGKWLGRVNLTPDLGKEKMDVMNFSLPLPPIHNLPSPLPENLTDLIKMDDYSVYPSHEPVSRLLLDAGASIPNFFTGLTAYFPFRFDFDAGVVLPDNALPGNRIAHVQSLPMDINPAFGRIALNASGEIVSSDKPADGSPSALSRFIQAYLRNDPYPLLLQPLPSANVPPPIWEIVRSFPPLVFPIPKPDPPLQLMRSVGIENMKITPSGKIVLASGTVRTEIFIPGVLGDEEGGLDVQGVLPEVLIFNGPVPEDDDDGVWAQERGDRPLPDPLPARVFGRLLPDDHLPSTSEMHPTIPRVLIVTSPFHDAPMEILDNAELRSFVGKIIFKGGALAGVKGTCDCRTLIKGLGSDVIEINGIPFQGDVFIGKQR